MEIPNVKASARLLSRANSMIRAGLQMAALTCLVLTMTGCPKNPTITASITTNACRGGVLTVSGSGFTKKGNVVISATNSPGLPPIIKIYSGTADGSGNINFSIPYYSPEASAGGGSLPGCRQNSGSTAAVIIIANDEASGSLTPVGPSTTVNILNCAMVWGQQCVS